MAHILRGYDNYCHAKKHDNMKADMVLLKELSILLLHLQGLEGECHTKPNLNI